MGLSKKTFLYSMLLAVIMTALLVGYFVLMLPSLYVSYVKESNYDAAVALQKGYMKERSYSHLQVKNPGSSVTLELPVSGDTFYIANQFFRLTVNVRDEELQTWLARMRVLISDSDRLEEVTEDDFQLELLKEKLFPDSSWLEQYPLGFAAELTNQSDIYKAEGYRVHMSGSDMIVMESSASEGDNYYTSYIAAGKTEDAVIITFMSSMTPRMDEIQPVIFKSLPMITAVVFLLALIASRIFSGKIVNPIIRLAGYTKQIKDTGNLAAKPFVTTGKDEIAELGQELNELYGRLKSSYEELENKNRTLEEENKRQEVFLRASSHQLKTPITAALLLVEGMINEVGKYKNTKEYLPEVKNQLQSMRKIVGDILYLNHCVDYLEIESFMAEEVVEDCVGAYTVQIAMKKLEVTIESGESSSLSGRLSCRPVNCDKDIAKKMMDNLFSNAVQYTPEGERIEIVLYDKSVRIKNYGASIENGLLPNIYEPFVSSDTKQKGRGLGLYVVSYYAKLLDCRIEIKNFAEGVSAELTFP